MLITKPKGVAWVSKKTLRRCFNSNPDGAGFAYAKDNKVFISKGYFNFNSLFRAVKKLKDYPVMLHFRLATHGSVKTANCHPFPLRNIGGAMAHNGILSFVDIKKDEDITDSEKFASDYLSKFDAKTLSSKSFVDILQEALGTNKIAVLLPTGEFIHYNKELGIEKNGIWFSNSGFMPQTRTFFEPENYYSNCGGYWRKDSIDTADCCGYCVVCDKQEFCYSGRWEDQEDAYECRMDCYVCNSKACNVSYDAYKNKQGENNEQFEFSIN